MAESKFSEKDFDPSERARVRQVVDMVIGNGKPGINARLRKVELIGGWILLGIAAVFIEGIALLIQVR